MEGFIDFENASDIGLIAYQQVLVIPASRGRR
jgi:hypothetical protein